MTGKISQGGDQYRMLKGARLELVAWREVGFKEEEFAICLDRVLWFDYDTNPLKKEFLLFSN